MMIKKRRINLIIFVIFLIKCKDKFHFLSTPTYIKYPHKTARAYLASLPQCSNPFLTNNSSITLKNISTLSVIDINPTAFIKQIYWLPPLTKPNRVNPFMSKESFRFPSHTRFFPNISTCTVFWTFLYWG